jgi:oleandomycin transport system permease protein
MSTLVASTPLRSHVSPAASLRQALVLTRRSLLRIKTNPEELIGLTLMPVTFVLLFTYVFGSAIAGSPSAYLQYALPGILVQGVFFSTMYSGYGLNTDIKSGIFDRFRSPLGAAHRPGPGRPRPLRDRDRHHARRRRGWPAPDL